eukprot:6459701-Amphidinium_carterae.3
MVSQLTGSEDEYSIRPVALSSSNHSLGALGGGSAVEEDLCRIISRRSRSPLSHTTSSSPSPRSSPSESGIDLSHSSTPQGRAIMSWQLHHLIFMFAGR